MSKKILITTTTSESKIKYTIEKIREYLAAKNYEGEIDFEGANVYTMKIDEIAPDVVVLIGPRSFSCDAPIIDGSGFVTKVSTLVDAACEKIYQAIQ